MTDTTDEKLKQRLKGLYDDSREYSLGQISEASGMALDRIKELEAKLADAERVARYESDIAQQALDQMRAAEAALPVVHRLALVDAGLICEQLAEVELTVPNPPYVEGYSDAASICFENIRALPTPTAAELMARINEGE